MSDGLPTNCCQKCYEAMKISLQLMNKFIDSDSKLRNMKTIKEDCLEETFDGEPIVLVKIVIMHVCFSR